MKDTTTREQKRSQWIEEARIIDNAFMHAFFDGNKEAAELVLQIILNRKDFKVNDIQVEKHLKNLHGSGLTHKRSAEYVAKDVRERCIIYVNGAFKDDSTELGRLMHDFTCSDPDEMYYQEIAKKVRYLKRDNGGIKEMTEYYDKWEREIAEEAITDKSLEIAMNLITDGTLSYDAIAKATGLTIEKVTELARAKAV